VKARRSIKFAAIFIWFIVLCTNRCFAQDDKTFKRYSAGIHLGIQPGIGRNTLRIITSPANPNFDLEYFSSKRYRHPAIRIRLFGDMRISKIFSIGLQTGTTIHFHENYYGVVQNSVTVPVQGALKFEVSHLEKMKAGLNFYSGFNLQRIKMGPFEERSGSLITGELAVKWGRRVHSIISGGVEYQQDRNRYYLDGDTFTIPLKDDIIKTRQDRWQVYFSYGIGLW
jgi:hypothetical protein